MDDSNIVVGTDPSLPYPAVYHLRVIGVAGAFDRAAVERIVANAGNVIEGLGAGTVETGRLSAEGKYQSLQVSVVFESRAAHEALHEALRSVSGVKMVL